MSEEPIYPLQNHHPYIQLTQPSSPLLTRSKIHSTLTQLCIQPFQSWYCTITITLYLQRNKQNLIASNKTWLLPTQPDCFHQNLIASNKTWCHLTKPDSFQQNLIPFITSFLPHRCILHLWSSLDTTVTLIVLVPHLVMMMIWWILSMDSVQSILSRLVVHLSIDYILGQMGVWSLLEV
jgi:hypothetical protein